MKYIILSAILCCACGSIAAQQATEQLPSEETMQQIESYAERPGMSTRSKPGGGPGLGEVETPISNYSLAGLLIAGLTYAGFLYGRNRKKA